MSLHRKLAKSVLLVLGIITLGALEATAQDAPTAPEPTRDLIVRAELVKVAARSPDLLRAVRSLRSHMVDTTRGSSRGVRSMDVEAPGRTATGASGGVGATRNTPAPTPILYVDGKRIGHLTLMQDILTAEVEEVKYLNPNRAAGELGLGHEGGAILVKMHRPSAP